MFWIIILLKLPVVTKLELFYRYLQFFIKDLDVILLSDVSLDSDEVHRAVAKEAFPLNDTSTTVLYGWQRVLGIFDLSFLPLCVFSIHVAKQLQLGFVKLQGSCPEVAILPYTASGKSPARLALVKRPNTDR